MTIEGTCMGSRGCGLRERELLSLTPMSCTSHYIQEANIHLNPHWTNNYKFCFIIIIIIPSTCSISIMNPLNLYLLQNKIKLYKHTCTYHIVVTWPNVIYTNEHMYNQQQIIKVYLIDYNTHTKYQIPYNTQRDHNWVKKQLRIIAKTVPTLLVQLRAGML